MFDFKINKLAVLSSVFFTAGLISLALIYHFISMPMVSSILTLILFCLSFMFGYISMRVAKKSKDKLKYSFLGKLSFYLCAIMIAIVMLSNFAHFPSKWDNYRNPHRGKLFILYICFDNYAAENNGRLPDKEMWCDKMKLDHKFEKRDFCYAINENVCNRVLKELPGNTVLAYKTNIGWNLAGGRELLMPQDLKSGEDVLLANGKIVEYKYSKDGEPVVEKGEPIPCWGTPGPEE